MQLCSVLQLCKPVYSSHQVSTTPTRYAEGETYTQNTVTRYPNLGHKFACLLQLASLLRMTATTSSDRDGREHRVGVNIILDLGFTV